MTEVEFESEAFLKLLTDALRSGPGSPEWRDATKRLREEGLEHADEYQMLVTAREHLESGKEYRSISAGPEFTRKLMEDLEQETVQSAGKPQTAMLIAAGCAVGMLLVVLSIGYLLWHASDEANEPSLLVRSVATMDLLGKANTEWRKIGNLPLEVARGNLRYIASTEPNGTGGGYIWDKPIPTGEPFAIQVSLRVASPRENVIAQVFVTDDPNFSEENGTTPHELVWLLQSNQAQVILPTGRVQARSDLLIDSKIPMTMRITVDGPEAAIDVNRTSWWKGAHLLDPEKPRYVGVRFLRRDGGLEEGISITGVRVNMRQP